MKVKINMFLIILVLITTNSNATGIDIENLYETSYQVDHIAHYYDYNHFSSTILNSNTIIAASIEGVWSNIGENRTWARLMSCTPYSPYNNIKDELNNEKKIIRFNGPPKKMVNTINNEIIILDTYYNNLYKLIESNSQKFFSEIWRKGSNKYKSNHYADNFGSFSIYDNILLYGLYLPSKDNKLVVIQHLDKSNSDFYKRIFSCPPRLRQHLESVGIKYPHCLPVLNPFNNTIWIAIWGYEYILIIDTTGQLLDSIHISGSGYIKPQIQKSRIHSQAVWRDWLSSWTPVKNFNFVSPNYFILQYRTGWEEHGADTIPLYSTLMWNTDRQPVEIEIDKHWQIAGVQPDGRIIFAHYLIEGDKREIVLNVTRIVP